MCSIVALVILPAGNVIADVNVSPDPSNNWFGFVNVFNTEPEGGGYIYGFSTPSALVPGSFDGATLTLGPNTSTYTTHLADPFWVDQITFQGNKKLNCAFYVDDYSLLGQTVNFSGYVLSNTLDGTGTKSAAYNAYAYIQVLDSATGYGIISSTTAPLDVGSFQLTLAIPTGATLIPQFGFAIVGDNAPEGHSHGSVTVSSVPEPATFALLCGLLSLGFVLFQRRRD